MSPRDWSQELDNIELGRLRNRLNYALSPEGKDELSAVLPERDDEIKKYLKYFNEMLKNNELKELAKNIAWLGVNIDEQSQDGLSQELLLQFCDQHQIEYGDMISAINAFLSNPTRDKTAIINLFQ